MSDNDEYDEYYEEHEESEEDDIEKQDNERRYNEWKSDQRSIW